MQLAITVDTKFPTRLQPRVQAPLLIEPSPLNSPSPIHTMATKSIRPLSRLRPSAHLSPKPLSHSRSFHSYDHPAPPPPFTAVESSILSAATHHIPSHGFTHTTLALGARDAGYLDASTNLFPRGAFSVVHYYLWAKREGLKDVVKELEAREGGVGSAKAWKEMGVGGRVKALTWERLMGNREVVHRWQEVRLSHTIPPPQIKLTHPRRSHSSQHPPLCPRRSQSSPPSATRSSSSPATSQSTAAGIPSAHPSPQSTLRPSCS